MVKNKAPRALGLIDVFCLGLNAIIGSGIFLFPGTLAALVGPASIFAFLTCGVLLAAVALCYAELSAMFPGNGGSYLYAREAFGDEAGFGVGLIAWAAAILSWSAVAAILAGHLSYFHPVFEQVLVQKLIAAVGIAVFAGINYRGVKPGAWTVDFLTLAKVLPLVVFVVAGLGSVEPARWQPIMGGEGRFGYAVFLSLWALQGFEVAPIPAGETANPQKDIPKAVVGSLLSAAVFYAIIQAVAVAAYPDLAASKERPLADAATYFMGPWGGRMLAVAGVVSMTGFIAGAALGAPRYLSAIGSRTLGPLRLDQLHRNFATPYRAIFATAGSCIFLILVFDFSKLIDLSNLAVVSQYLASCLALLTLRRSRPEAKRPYRVPAALLVALVGCGISIWLMTQVTRQEILGTLGILALGYVFRWGIERVSRR